MKRKINKILVLLVAIVYLVGFFYLLLPPPLIPPLPDSFKSTEPGDTVEIPGLWAYYTNFSRSEVIDFYKEAFSHSSFLGIPLPTYVLNHPPEYARETIRPTLHSNFYEELVHPLRESLFINGWSPSQDERYLKEMEILKRPPVDFLIEGEHYQIKVTFYPVQSSFWARLLVWTGIVVAVIVSIYFASVIFCPSVWGYKLKDPRKASKTKYHRRQSVGVYFLRAIIFSPWLRRKKK